LASATTGGALFALGDADARRNREI